MRSRFQLIVLAALALAGCEAQEARHEKGSVGAVTPLPPPAKENVASTVSSDGGKDVAKYLDRRSGNVTQLKSEKDIIATGSCTRSSGQNINLHVTDEPVAHVLNLISQEVDVSIFLRGESDAKVTLSLHDVPWRDVVAYIARRAKLKSRQEGKLLVLEAPPRNTLQASDADETMWLILLAREGGKSIILPGGLHGKVTCELHDVPWEDALRITAETQGCRVETVK